MSTAFAPLANNPLPPRQENSVTLEGRVRDIIKHRLPSGHIAYNVSIEHIRFDRGRKKSTPWFWLQFVGTIGEAFSANFAVGSKIWIRGRLDNQPYIEEGTKTRRLIVVVQEMAKEKPPEDAN